MTEPASRTSCSAAPQDLQALITLASDFRWELDEALRFCALAGPLIERGTLDPKQLIGQRLTDWPAERLRETGTDAAMAAIRARQAFHELHCALPLIDGSLRWFALAGLPRFTPTQHFSGYQGVAADITAKLDEEAHYRHLAMHDALTGLPNRRLLADRVEQAIHQARRQGTRLAIMLVDLDHFKHINDRFGHAVGDRTLIALATALGRAVRQSDTVARLGGDEFVILLPRVGNAMDAVNVARKIIDHLAQTGPHLLTASAGLSLFPDHGVDLHNLLMQADQAMYRAKRDGGNGVRMAEPIAPERLR